MLALILATKIDVPMGYSMATLIGTLNIPALRISWILIRTVIVVPLSVLSNWEKQIADHVKDGALSYCVYYGSGRSMTPEQLKKYDVVLSTYQTVAKEYGDFDLGRGLTQKRQKTENALFSVKWKVRQEAHVLAFTY